MARTRGPRTATALLERAVIDAFDGGTPLSRVELVQRTGLSRTVITALVDRLIERGVLTTAPPAPRPDGGRGRRSTAYRLNRALTSAALVHAHRTHTSVTLATPDGPLVEHGIDVPWTRPWEEWAGAVQAALDEAEDRHDRSPPYAVVAVPFPVRHPAGDIPAAPSQPAAGHGSPVAEALDRWRRDDPRPRLARMLGRPVYLHNDANLAALGEAHYGAARDATAAIHVSVRHGVGAGIIIDGRLFTGALGTAGELAHVQVVEDGPYCPCGNRGCLATQTAGPETDPSLARLYERPLTTADIHHLLVHNDPIAVRFFRDLGRLVARALAGTIIMLNPDTIVIDATLDHAHPAFTDGLSTNLAHHCPPSHLHDLRIIPGTLPSAHAYGALALHDAGGRRGLAGGFA